MRTETDLCPIDLSWASLQRKVPPGKHCEIVHDMLRGVGTDHSDNEFVGGLSK